MSWDPTQYLKFGNQRLRPALDLLGQIPLQAPGRVVDLGCGAGNVTWFLAERWPQAQVTGVDGSAEMLDKARSAEPRLSTVRWAQADMSVWQAGTPVELIYSNAALHWLPDHDVLFPRLIKQLQAGGVLAVQMPRNFAAPSHAAMDQALDALGLTGPDRARIDAVKLHSPVAAPEQYYDWIRPLTSQLDVWESIYQHVLQGENAVAEWTKGTALIPVMDGLKALSSEAGLGAENGLHQRFWLDYCARTNAAYPRRADGSTLFPFRRLFIVATR